LKALHREEKKLLKLADNIGGKVRGIRAAINAMSESLSHPTKSTKPVKRRKMSAAARKKIAAAQKKRWVKVRATKASATRNSKKAA
jgi:hypothetical protein